MLYWWGSDEYILSCFLKCWIKFKVHILIWYHIHFKIYLIKFIKWCLHSLLLTSSLSFSDLLLVVCSGFQTQSWQLNMRVVFVVGLNPTPYGTSWQSCTTCVRVLEGTPLSRGFTTCQVLIRFFALHRIKPHAPPLVRDNDQFYR